MATVVQPRVIQKRRKRRDDTIPQLLGAINTGANLWQRQQQIEAMEQYRQSLTDYRENTSEQADIRILMQSGDPRLMGIAGDMMSNRMGNPLAGPVQPEQPQGSPSVNDPQLLLPEQLFSGFQK